MPQYMLLYVKQEAGKKQHFARGGTNKTPFALIVSKHLTKRIAESLHAQITRARLGIP